MNFYQIFFVLICLFYNVVAKTSFTLVLNTAASMEYNVITVRNTIRSVFDHKDLDIEKYNLILFNDQYVSPPMVLYSHEELLYKLNDARANDKNCPENTVEAIERAIEHSNPDSDVFVFTDVVAKSSSGADNIASMCGTKNIRLQIFLCGQCEKNRSVFTDDQVYLDLAKSCSGNLLKFNPRELTLYAHTFINLMMNNKWTEIITQDTFYGLKNITITTEAFTKDLVLCLSHSDSDFQFENKGKIPIQTIFYSPNVLVTKLTSPRERECTFTIGSVHGKTSVTIYKKVSLQFSFGFSVRRPYSLKETSTRPLPGYYNFILLQVPSSRIILDTLIIEEMGVTAALVQIDTQKNLYVAGTIFHNNSMPFKLTAQAHDSDTLKNITGSTDFLTPQSKRNFIRLSSPKIEIIPLENTTVLYGTHVSIVCKVIGHPEPKIWWEKGDGMKVTNEVFQLNYEPPTYISAWDIYLNVTGNIIVDCKTKNSEGKDAARVSLTVYRPLALDIIESLQDTIFEYGTEGKLQYSIMAYPEPEIKWYHNETEIDFKDSEYYEQQNDGLLFKNMAIDNVGSYKCIISNSIGKEVLTANVNISGIEIPQIEVDSEFIMNPGDRKEIECKCRGSPKPDMNWLYKAHFDDYDYTNTLPDGVTIDDTKILISDVKTTHAGVYKCTAENIVGEDFGEFSLKVHYAPKIVNQMKNITAVRGREVQLVCEVDAEPRASVRWGVTRNNVIQVLDKTHVIDEHNTHRFIAKLTDSGEYHCQAENYLGSTVKTASINVVVAPRIQAPEVFQISKRVGDRLELTCQVVEGYPTPTITWKFFALNSTPRIIQSGTGTSTIKIDYLYKNHEGNYLCVADNEVATDRIRIHVKVY